MKVRRSSIALTLALVLPACGGGSSDEATPPSETPDGSASADSGAKGDASTTSDADASANTGADATTPDAGGDDATTTSDADTGGDADATTTSGSDSGGDATTSSDADTDADAAANGDADADAAATLDAETDADAASTAEGGVDAGDLPCSAPCKQGQRCVNGACACDAVVCPHGCCTAGPDSVCKSPDGATCGTAGETCVDCTATPGFICSKTQYTCIDYNNDANNCGSDGTKCDVEHGQRCLGGHCRCDATSCPDGCCTTLDYDGFCQPHGMDACGNGGAECATCDPKTANACGENGCECDGKPACIANGWWQCVGGTGCIDLADDPHNCGAVEHDCLGGGCYKGQCQPVELAEITGTPMRIAIDGNHVYFTEVDRHNVWQIGKSGGEAQLIYGAPGDSPTNSVWAITTNGPSTKNDAGVWVANRAAGQIISVSYDGSTIDDSLTSNLGADAQPYGITWVADSGNGEPYWTDFKAEALEKRVFRFNQVPPYVAGTLRSPAGDATGLVAVGNTVFWTTYTGGVFKIDTDGTNFLKLSGTADNVESRFVTSDGTVVFWTDAGRNSVFGVNASGEGLTPISDAELYPEGIALDASGLYWANLNCTEAKPDCIRRWKLGEGVVSLGGFQDGPEAIATDDEAIYWVNRTGKQVMKLAK